MFPHNTFMPLPFTRIAGWREVEHSVDFFYHCKGTSTLEFKHS